MQDMQGAVQVSVHAPYFGRRHIGAIEGFAITLAVAGTALGPLIFALGFERFGGYGPILALTAVPPLFVAAVSALFRLEQGRAIR